MRREDTEPLLAVDESEPLGRQLSSSLIWQSMENARELSSSSRRAERRGDSRSRIWTAAGQRESAWQQRSACAAWQRQLRFRQLRWAAAVAGAAPAACSTPVLTPVLAAPRRSISLCQRPSSAESSASYTCATSSSAGAEIDSEIDGAAAGARGPKPSSKARAAAQAAARSSAAAGGLSKHAGWRERLGVARAQAAAAAALGLILADLTTCSRQKRHQKRARCRARCRARAQTGARRFLIWLRRSLTWIRRRFQ